MIEKQFTSKDIWKGIILFGLNAATYKMALAKSLLEFSSKGKTKVPWNELSENFLAHYQERLKLRNMPQQGTPHRRTVMERIVKRLQSGALTYTKAIEEVGDTAFNDVIRRFQTIGRDSRIVGEHFYEFEFGKRLILKDSLLSFSDGDRDELESELIARWGLLEGAFSITAGDYELANDIREIYLRDGYERTSLTGNIPFLSGYQGNGCFYCGEVLCGDVHVDHVLPRQVVNHDEIWNLVLAHGDCNMLKADKLVGLHFIKKLIARNENIMGSNHPWKNKISSSLGTTPKKRSKQLEEHYDKVKEVLGMYWWGGSPSYNPETDPFYRRLITAINNPDL